MPTCVELCACTSDHECSTRMSQASTNHKQKPGPVLVFMWTQPKPGQLQQVSYISSTLLLPNEPYQIKCFQNIPNILYSIQSSLYCKLLPTVTLPKLKIKKKLEIWSTTSLTGETFRGLKLPHSSHVARTQMH